MLQMSFYNGTLNKSKAKDFINMSSKLLFLENSNKTILAGHGILYRAAEKKMISKQQAIEIINTISTLDIIEHKDDIVLTVYEANNI